MATSTSTPYVPPQLATTCEQALEAARTQCDALIAPLKALEQRLQNDAQKRETNEWLQRRCSNSTLEVVSRLLGRLGSGAGVERVQQIAAKYKRRFQELESSQQQAAKERRQVAATDVARFLPTAPRHDANDGGDGRTTKNYAAIMSKEAGVALGLQPRQVEYVRFDMCERCNVGMRYDQVLQQLVCSCGHWKRFADMTSAALAFGEEIEFCKFSYRPVTHLDDTIKFAEATESYVVPASDLLLLMEILRSRRIKPEDVRIQTIRSIISELRGKGGIKLENTVQIYARLTGRSAWRFTEFQKGQLRLMFGLQEKPYRKHCGSRTNNLDYRYKIYKNCELLGYWEFLEALPLIRPNNILQYDHITAKVFQELDWQFIPTIQNAYVTDGVSAAD